MSESIERQKSEYVTLSTHVLNLSTGMPQRGLAVSMLNEDGDFITKGITEGPVRIKVLNALSILKKLDLDQLPT